MQLEGYHKDGFFPGNGHGLRYHRPEYLLFFYYPQDTTELRGPTEILPQSQYYANDAAPEPDSHPLIGRIISGGDDDHSSAEGDQEYARGVNALRWPGKVERLTVPAGSVVLTHFDVFHRGTYGPYEEQPTRLMLKLWYCRMQEPRQPSWDHHPAAAVHPATSPFGSSAESVIWLSIWQWMLGDRASCNATTGTAAQLNANQQLLMRACSTSRLESTQHEPARVAAAYALACHHHAAFPLLAALRSIEAEPTAASAARSAAYALAALPAAGAATTLSELGQMARHSPSRDLRVLSVFSLGQSAATSAEGFSAMLHGLMHDDSGFVRSTAAAALGFAGRRTELDAQRAAAIRGLSGVIALDTAEADGDRDFIGPGGDGVTKQRSAVRENSAIALAMIATVEGEEEEVVAAWGATSSVLGKVLASDANKFVHGFVHEVVTRLAATSIPMGEVLATFAAGPRWRPPHNQVETGFVSAPSEFLFVNDLSAGTSGELQVFDDSNGLR